MLLFFGSAFPIRIRIQDSQMNEVPVPIVYLYYCIVNMYSYAIVRFQLEKLRTGISGTRQAISEVLGMMTTVGSMRPSLTTTSLTLAVLNPRLVTRGVPIQDELSAVVAPDRDTFSETAHFVSDLPDAN
jgi:hypothetical protein